MLRTDFSFEQLSCGNGTLLCVGTVAGVVKMQNFLQAVIMHHWVSSSKGLWYHTVKVYTCIERCPTEVSADILTTLNVYFMVFLSPSRQMPG
jgi:hypothetical protein